MKKLFVYLKGYEKETILAPLFKLLEAFFDLCVPLVVAKMINDGIGNQDRQMIVNYIILLVVLALAGLLCSFTAQYFAAKASLGFGTKLRQVVFDHIQSLSYKQLDTVGTSTLMTRLTSDINQVQTGLNMGLRLLLRSPLIVIGSMIMAFTINVQAALIFVVTIPLLSVVVFGIMVKSIPLFKKAQSYLDRITGKTRENLSGVRVIRAFCKEADEVKDFDEKNEALTQVNEVVGKLSALLNPVTYAIINIATMVLIYTGALQINLGTIQQGDVVALYNYMGQMIIELIKLASLMITLNKAIACGERVEQILEVPTGMDYTNEEIHPTEKGTVSFDHVSLSYEEGSEEAISNITFEVQAGQTIGVIGGTGSGKSTLVNMIPRFYDATSGEVKVDGFNVQQYTKEELIKRIGIVPQKAVLFQGTIRDNMKWGKEDASDEEIHEALKLAQAEEILNHHEGGLDYQIEQNGRNLSGGQKQRFTIARALLKKPEIIILDDSASALDFATDASLRKAIRGMSKSLTTFIVSQRASSIMQADQIIVLNDGELVGLGKHDDLMKTCTVYQEIYYSQFPEQRKSVIDHAE